MPRSLIYFYLYKYLRYKKKIYIYIFVNVFLATTVKEDEEFICGELARRPAHRCCLLYLIQAVVNVWKKPCKSWGLFHLTAVGSENGFPIKSTEHLL